MEQVERVQSSQISNMFAQIIKTTQQNNNKLSKDLENFLPSNYNYLIQEFSEIPISKQMK
ncbi:11062_t:CDS:2, partial [Dentiscutata heterogama]